MSRPHLIVVLLVVAMPVCAQTLCYAEYDGPTFADNVSMGGPNLLVGIKFTIPLNVQATQIEVFTGEGSGTNTLGIWTHDAVSNQPGVDLGTGSWSMSNTNSWQGALLPAAIPLVSGITYWLVWGPINGAQSSTEAPLSFPGQVYRPSFDGGQTWSGPFQSNNIHYKFRVYGLCGAAPGCQAIEITDVAGSLPAPNLIAPTGAVISTLTLSSAQSATTSIRLRIASDQPFQPYLLAAGLVLLPAPVPVAPLGGFVALDVGDPGFLVALDGFSTPGLATTDAQGIGEFAFALGVLLPSGFDLYVQGVVICASGGVTVTDTAQLAIQ